MSMTAMSSKKNIKNGSFLTKSLKFFHKEESVELEKMVLQYYGDSIDCDKYL